MAVAAAALWLWVAAGVAGAQVVGAAPVQATGLRPPTAEEQAWMERNLVTTRRVLPNALALERINRERRAKGVAPLEVQAVPVGYESREDITPDCGGGMDLGPAQGGGAKDGVKATLPAAADNSTLPSFPPVRSQDSLGSCAAFSTTYYAGSHMTGLARGWNNRDNPDNARLLSPKWTYNLANGGSDTGSWFSTIMDIMMKLGAPSWAEFPYVGDNTNAANYLEWSRDAAVWRSAAGNRFQAIGRVQAVDTASGLANLKALLADGYAVLYATHVFSWQFMPFSDDPSTTADNAFVGRRCCWKVSAEANSGHAMTLVGYNDDLWVDINKNGVVDAGEKGALKVANSWGLTGWWQAGSSDGFGWIAYDALRATSAVSGVGSGDRQAAFWFSEVYWITARASYTPALLGQFTLNCARRNQLNLKVGVSSTAAGSPEAYFPETTVFGWQNSSDTWPQAFIELGGPYNFAGGTTALSGTFALDLTDLVQSGTRRYYVAVRDTAAGYPTALSDFRLVTPAGSVLATATAGVPANADNSRVFAYADLALGGAPVINSPVTASGTVGVPFSYTITATNSPTAFGASGLPPGLAVDPATGVISGTPTQAGAGYVVGLSASNASGVGTATLTITISSQAIAAPAITSPTTATATVGQAFSYTITATNSPTAFGASGLPGGLAVNTSTGAITGIPTLAGTFAVALTAANAGGTGTGSLQLTVQAAPAQVPVITSASTASGVSSSPFSYRILATNNPTSYGAAGLPATLSLDPATGDITGLLPAPGNYPVTLSASNAAGTGYLELLLTVTGSSIYGPPNDAFANRIPLAGIAATANGTNENATAETGEPVHAGYPARRSVWWTWTAPASGPVTIHTVGSGIDTLLAVYTGTALGTLTETASDDDSGGSGASLVRFEAAAGTAYQIAVDGYAGSTGPVALSVEQTPVAGPPNDLFADRVPLTGAAVAATGASHGAGAEPGEPAHAGYPARRSVWWTWTAPAAGQATIDTIGSDFDTLLAVYTGSTLQTLVEVASDDQSGGANTSRVVFGVAAGAVFQIAVDGWSGQTGAVQLHIALSGGAPPNDRFADRLVLAGETVTATGTSTNASAETGEPAHAGYRARRSVWWTWTAPGPGIVTLDTAESSFDTVLAVYTGASLPTLAPLAANDDGIPGTRASRVQFYVSGATVCQIAVDGYGGESGAVSLHLVFSAASPNDNFVNRAVLTGASVSVAGGNVGATAEANEPRHYLYPAVSSVWWTWTAPAGGTVTITTAGSSFDTVLAVYRGMSLAALMPVVSNDDAGGALTSQVSFYATADTVFQIAVDGYAGAQGRIELALTQTPSTVLYSTDFEDFPSGIGALDSYDGWRSTDAEASGTSGVFFSGSQVAWLGFNRTDARAVYVFRPVNYDPLAAATPLISFSVDWALHDSTVNRYDSFGFALYNTANEYLALILLDNATMKIYRDSGSGTPAEVGTFANGRTYRLQAFLDFASNRWSATLDGTVLFTNQPLHTGGRALSLGDMDAVWFPRTTGSPGDNYLVFDNFRLAIGGREGPSITTASPLPGGTVGSAYSRTLTATGGVTPYTWSIAAGSPPAGLQLGADGTLTGVPRAAGTAVFSVRVTGGDGLSSTDEFALTIEKGTQTIAFPALPAVTYGAPPVAPNAAASSGLPVTYASSDPSVAVVEGGTLRIAGAGTAAITASQPGDANWLPALDAQQVLTVAPAPLTITADDQEMVVGGPLPVLTATCTGLVNGDTPASLDVPVVLATTATPASPAGAYPITVSGAADPNYVITFVDGTLTIYAATHTVTFLSGPHGWIEGETTQTVPHRGAASPVTARPEFGYVFAQWSDGSTQNPRTLSNVAGDTVLTASFRTAEAVLPAGVFVAAVGAPGQGLWDLSGPYVTAVGGYPLTLALTHDGKGKITGTANLALAKGTVLTMPVKGTVKGSLGAVGARIAFKGTDPARTAAAALTLALTLDPASRRLLGTASGSVRQGPASIPISEPVALPVPEPMDGTWTLGFQLGISGAAALGAARLTLSNGAACDFTAKGKLAGRSAVLTLAGASSDPAAKSIKIKTTVAALEGGWAVLQSLSAKGYGQTLAW